MRVIFYDHTDRLRHGNTEPVGSLQELLAQSDVVSMHVPETPATREMIGRDEFAAMKDGAYFINNSRGTVVDLDALADALHARANCVARPSTYSPSSQAPIRSASLLPLQGLENVILTRHVGGSAEKELRKASAPKSHAN